MATKYDFKDNVTYGTDSINGIRQSIMSSGVIGVDTASCEVYNDNGIIKIKPGQVIFYDGSRLIIDAVETLTMTSGSINYIYAYNNTVANVNELKVDGVIPASGDFVLLAKVEVTGNIVTDKRVFSRAKFGGASPTRYFHEETLTLPQQVDNILIKTISIPNVSNFCTVVYNKKVVSCGILSNTDPIPITIHQSSPYQYYTLCGDGKLYGTNSGSASTDTVRFIFEEVSVI